MKVEIWLDVYPRNEVSACGIIKTGNTGMYIPPVLDGYKRYIISVDVPHKTDGETIEAEVKEQTDEKS